MYLSKYSPHKIHQYLKVFQKMIVMLQKCILHKQFGYPKRNEIFI